MLAKVGERVGCSVVFAIMFLSGTTFLLFFDWTKGTRCETGGEDREGVRIAPSKIEDPEGVFDCSGHRRLERAGSEEHKRCACIVHFAI